MFPKIFKNNLTQEEIEGLTSYININLKDFGELNNNNYWSGRTLHYDTVHSLYHRSLLLKSIRYSISILKEYLTNKEIYCEHLSIARWPVGYSLEPHADAENPPGCDPHPYPWRDFACITFLNDNFKGGVLYFPKLKSEIIPQPGYSIVFPGTLEYLHGVTNITDGNRYTIASFLTYDKNKEYIRV